MIDLKGIQILGVLLALILILYSLKKYKTKDFTPKDLILSLSISSGLILVALHPGVFDYILSLLSLKERWMAIFIIADLILLSLFFILFTSIRRTQQDLRELVRSLALKEAKENSKEQAKPEKFIQVVIPAYNEADNISEVLSKIPNEVFGYKVEPLVVVDGSTDETEEIVKKFEHEAITHVVNLGQGGALKTGFEIALSKGADFIVTMDADGQHLPEELPGLVKPIIENDADFTIGSRYLGKYERDSRIRDMGIRFFTTLINLLTGVKITDCTSGYRCFSAQALRKLDLKEERFNAPELIISAAKKGLRIKEVPITIKRRIGGKTKKPKLGYAWGLGTTILKTWLRE